MEIVTGSVTRGRYTGLSTNRLLRYDMLCLPLVMKLLFSMAVETLTPVL